MPTGYTDQIKDGIDFKTFAMNCARAFGACAGVGPGEIPETFEPRDYHFEAYFGAYAKLLFLDEMNAEELEAAATKEWEEAEKYRNSRALENQKIRAAYEAMLEKVRAWQPPTADHKGLKEFMIEQIESSIKFDCMLLPDGPNERLTGEEWGRRRRENLTKDKLNHKKSYQNDVLTAAQRTAWVKALRESL